MVTRRPADATDPLAHLWRWLRASDTEARAMAHAARPEVRAWVEAQAQAEHARREARHRRRRSDLWSWQDQVAREALAVHDAIAREAWSAHEQAVHDAMHHMGGGLP